MASFFDIAGFTKMSEQSSDSKSTIPAHSCPDFQFRCMPENIPKSYLFRVRENNFFASWNNFKQLKTVYY